MIISHSIPPNKIQGIQDFDLDYWVMQNPDLKNFYSYPPSFDSISHAIQRRKESPLHREILCQELYGQYQLLEHTDLQIQNIKLLQQENTFTVTTAHQPCVFSGPLFVIYKILHAIKLSQQLNSKFPEYHFIPVYYCGIEDHDFDEIKSIHFQNESFTWEHESGGPVGRFNLDGIQELFSQIELTLGPQTHQTQLFTKVKDFIKQSATYSEFYIKWVHFLFGEYGLIILNPDNPAFKHVFKDIFKDELINQQSEKIVTTTNAQLKSIQFKNQAHVREINLFHVSKNARRRIEKTPDGITIANEKINTDQIQYFLDSEIQNISTNVILRPLYQSLLLPDVVFVGGGGEIAYWLQLKSLFEQYNISYPILCRRSSFALLDTKTAQQLEQLQIPIAENFKDLNTAHQYYLQQHNLKFSLDQEIQTLQLEWNIISEKLHAVDPTLKASAEAEFIKIKKSIEHLEQKGVKVLKNKEQTQLARISKAHAILYPEQTLQERRLNFLPYYVNPNFNFFELLLDNIDGFNPDFKVLSGL